MAIKIFTSHTSCKQFRQDNRLSLIPCKEHWRKNQGGWGGDLGVCYLGKFSHIFRSILVHFESMYMYYVNVGNVFCLAASKPGGSAPLVFRLRGRGQLPPPPNCRRLCRPYMYLSTGSQPLPLPHSKSSSYATDFKGPADTHCLHMYESKTINYWIVTLICH